MKQGYWISLFFSACTLILSTCREKQYAPQSPIALKIMSHSDKYMVVDSVNTPSILIEISNISNDDVLVKYCQSQVDKRPHIVFNNIFFFSGEIANVYSYPGPRPIVERSLCYNNGIDTIKPNQKSIFSFDPVYSLCMTDSLDYIFFTFPIQYKQYNDKKYYFRSNNFEYLIPTPFFVFEIENMNFRACLEI